MDITINESNGKGYAIAKIDGKQAGLMSYVYAGDKHIIIDHTEVDNNYRGQDVGLNLLYKIVEMARDKHIEITPLCPFANVMFKRHDNIKDVLK